MAMGSLAHWLGLIPLAPLVAAILTGALALTRRAERAAPLLTLTATLIAAITALLCRPHPATVTHQVSAEWLRIGPQFTIGISVKLDPLAWVMVCVVCLISLLVQIYSIGYMRGENGYARYFAYLGLFTASMLGLVTADNLFQLYVCWELVGICSYLLIGFWWFRPSAANAAKKAFIVTRFGDVGFLLGVLLLSGVAGSFQFDAVGQAVDRIAHGAVTTIPLVSASGFLILAPLLLFCGAVGKSAQFPLHIWLPDAMEGPTPVSALIHAATMVVAGVYMVARLFPIFAASTVAMNTVLVTGTVTALIAATIALVQTDIKKVLAYSTISQLGYMMLGLGAGGQTASIFHLVTHAMFKALLFLAAGSVIHALHHADNPNDLRAMGGLGSRMRSTALTCGIGVLALAGLPPLSGFWSKDAILGAALDSPSPYARVALIVGILVAGLTAFYSMRLWMLAFSGSPRSEAAAHAHESPVVMTLPLWILAVPSVLLGGYLHFGNRFADFLTPTGQAPTEGVHLWLVAVTSLVAVGGIGLAWRIYRAPDPTGDPVVRMPGYALFVNLWYIDAFWKGIAANGVLAIGRSVAWFDRNVVDGAVNGVGTLCERSGYALRRTTNGQVQSYATVLVAALVIAALTLALSQTAPTPIHGAAISHTPGANR